MKIGRRNLLLLTGAALAMTVVAPATAQAAQRPTRTLVALPMLPGAVYGHALDINDSGVAVGESVASGRSYAMKWPTPFSVVQLQDLPYATGTSANGINNKGVIVGSTQIYPKMYATKWAADGTPTELLTPPGHRECMAIAINDNDVVAGDCVTDEGKSRVVRWAPDGTPTVLGTGGADIRTDARDINDNGTIVGAADSGDKQWAARWEADGQLRDLPQTADATYSIALSINNSGVVGGSMYAATHRAGLWAANGEWTYLADLPGTPGTPHSASGINNDGVVVGSGQTADRGTVAARWSVDGTVTRLPSLPNTRPDAITIAKAINRTGVIAGYSDGKPVQWLGYR